MNLRAKAGPVIFIARAGMARRFDAFVFPVCARLASCAATPRAVIWMGRGTLTLRKEFTTEHTESHGAARRSNGFHCRISLPAAAPIERRSSVRPAGGPVPPWNSVVLRALRGKISRNPRRTLTPKLTRSAVEITEGVTG